MNFNIVIENSFLYLVAIFATWVSYLAGLDFFSGLRQAYLRRELVKLKKALQTMFVAIKNNPRHPLWLENRMKEEKEDVRKEIRRRKFILRYKIKEALFLLSMSLACTLSLYFLF